MRKHKQQTSPLHPVDDLEASCYLLLAAAGDLPWSKVKKPMSKKIRSGKMAMGELGYKCKSKLATCLVDVIRSCRATQAALGSSVAARACNCPAAGSDAADAVRLSAVEAAGNPANAADIKACWCVLYTKMERQLSAFAT